MGERVFTFMVIDLMCQGLNARIARGVQLGGLTLD